MKKLQERRGYKRFSVKNRSTVLISPTTVLSYGVLDISDSGLAFSYTGWEKWPKEGVKIDILDQEFFLENLPVLVISDVQLNEGSKKLRRCGVNFIDLKVNQEAILRQYIESVAAN